MPTDTTTNLFLLFPSIKPMQIFMSSSRDELLFTWLSIVLPVDKRRRETQPSHSPAQMTSSPSPIPSPLRGELPPIPPTITMRKFKLQVELVIIGQKVRETIQEIKKLRATADKANTFSPQSPHHLQNSYPLGQVFQWHLELGFLFKRYQEIIEKVQERREIKASETNTFFSFSFAQNQLDRDREGEPFDTPLSLIPIEELKCTRKQDKLSPSQISLDRHHKFGTSDSYNLLERETHRIFQELASLGFVFHEKGPRSLRASSCPILIRKTVS